MCSIISPVNMKEQMGLFTSQGEHSLLRQRKEGATRKGKSEPSESRKVPANPLTEGANFVFL